jgi:surfactin synthase thioesterase subunit
VDVRDLKSEWIATFGANDDAGTRLVCLPYAGGTCTVFRRWPGWLPAAEVLPVQPPGRGAHRHREPCATIAELAEDLGRAVEPLLDRPYGIVGLCLGSLVGFELARTLVAQGSPAPTHVVVVGRRAPQIPYRGLPVVDDLDGDELVRQLRLTGGTPPAVLDDPALLRVYLPTIRADLRLAQSYRYVPGEPLPCPITVFAGRDDPIPPADLQGWAIHTTSGCEVRTVEGDHFFFRDHQAEFLGHVSRLLEHRRVPGGRW